MIGKTRQAFNGQIAGISAGKSRGVLGWPPETARLAVSRRLPAPALSDFIQHYWTVSWDLRGREPHLQETLPHPNTYLVFEFGKLLLYGVSTGKFTRLLEGQGRTFGVKFKPGGLRPFLRAAVSSLTDRTVAASSVFGKAADRLESRLCECQKSEEAMMEAANAFFLPQTPEPNETATLAAQLVERILEEPEIKAVDDLAGRSGIGKRSLQRIFSEYVGVSPKWVIRRYRLHELVERLNSGEELNWPDLALNLGYFDQSHLIHDFRSIAGYSPTLLQKQAMRKLP